MNQDIKEKYIHKVFIWGIIFKALNGALEIVGGIALCFSGVLTKLATGLLQNGLIGEADDFLPTLLQHWLPTITEHSQFLTMLYLLSHGIIKIFLAVGLLCNKLWAYPTAIIIFTIFILYQIYLYAFTPSLLLVFLTVFDLIVIGLTWHEYRYFKKYRMFPK